MIKHVVVWKIKDPAQKPAHAKAVKRALEALRGHIPGMLAIEVGIDIGYDAQADDVVLYAEFENRDALDAYQQHPLHLDAKAIVKVLTTDRRAIDWQG
ncbi:MAG TPA: Dabb family protein [Casimicrobiaceae bacterium]|jgi:quinol monooxygenase YgiN